MKISVVTTCFRSGRKIRDAMESVLAQQRPDGLEIDYIVKHKPSGDDSEAEIRAFEEKVRATNPAGFSFRWESGDDDGIYDGMNRGLKRAVGDVVGILNADDVFERDDVLADLARTFAADAELEAVYGDIRFRGADGKTCRYYSSAHWKPWMHSWGYMPAHPSIYVRRTVFDRLGYYRSDYRISGDFEWMVRVFCGNRRGNLAPIARWKYLPRCLVSMGHGGASTGSLGKMWRLNCENVRANRNNGYFCCLPMMVPKYFYKVLGLFRRNVFLL